MSKKILIVDDEQDLVLLISTRLQANGYEVVSAANGVEGLEKAKTENPDLIISDVLMPEMDGFGLYKELKKDAALSKIPVLILTARGKMEDTFRVMGVDDFIAKPFQQDDLVAKVNEKIQKLAPSDTPTASAETAETPKTESQEKVEAAPIPKEAPLPSSSPAPAAPAQPAGGGKLVFLLGTSSMAIKSIEQHLLSKGCRVERFEKKNDLNKAIEAIFPDIIVSDVILENGSVGEILIKLKESTEFKSQPIIVFNYLDKKNLGKDTMGQRLSKIDQAKKECVALGVAESLGGFVEQGFVTTMEKYL